MIGVLNARLADAVNISAVSPKVNIPRGSIPKGFPSVFQ